MLECAAKDVLMISSFYPSNNFRFDLSDYLIHFFRKLDVNGDDDLGDIEIPGGPSLPDYWGHDSYYENEEPISPFFLLRNAIRQGRLWATWSMRKGRRTIYGPDAAVCFTEMPLAAFIEAGSNRAARGQAMSAYGIVFQKTDIFRCGGLPVIYALSDTAAASEDSEDGTRLLPPFALNLREQFRYVAYDPLRQGRLDFTHEREWRWPLRNDQPPDYDLPPEVNKIPGLDFYDQGFRNMGLVVKTQRQARLALSDILRKIDRHEISADAFEFILPLEAIESPAMLRDPILAKEAVARARINLTEHQTCSVKAANRIRSRIKEAARSALRNENGHSHGGVNVGGCWLWITENTHRWARELIAASDLTVNADGKYLVSVFEFNDSWPIERREDLMRALATNLKEEDGLPCSYFSLTGSFDPDSGGIRHDDQFHNDIYFNRSADPDDY